MLDIKYNQDPPPISVFEKAQNLIKVAIYARVSSDNQDINNSIQAQISECKSYAARNNMVVVEIYVDEAESGTSDNRPQFQQMVVEGTGKDKPFEIILVWKFSRFSRSREDNPFYKSRLKKRGVRIVSISEPTDDSPAGQFMEGMIEEVDAFYSANLGHEVMRGFRKLAERGYYPGNKAPYGYNLRKVKEEDGNAYHNILVKDPLAAPIVRRIFDETMAGQSRNDIRRGLNADGITPPEPRHSKVARSEKWSRNTIGAIVHNLEHAGFVVWGKKSKSGQPPVVAPGRHEAIVSVDEFEAAGKAMNSRAPDLSHPKQTAGQYMLTELLKCANCGEDLIVRYSNEGKYRYYMCKTRVNEGAAVCDGASLNIWKFEKKFLEVLFDDILCPSNVSTALAKMADELMGPYEDQNAMVQSIEDELLDLSKQQARIMDAYEKGAYSVDDYIRRTSPLQTTEADLKRRLADAQDEIEHQTAALAKPEEVLAFTNQVADFIQHSAPKERKQMLKPFIKCIWIEIGKATVVYRIPLPADAKRPGTTELVMALDEPLPPTVRLPLVIPAHAKHHVGAASQLGH